MHAVHGAFSMLRLKALRTWAAMQDTFGSFEVFKGPKPLVY